MRLRTDIVTTIRQETHHPVARARDVATIIFPMTQSIFNWRTVSLQAPVRKKSSQLIKHLTNVRIIIATIVRTCGIPTLYTHGTLMAQDARRSRVYSKEHA